MKRILLYILFLASLGASAQIKIGVPFVKNNPADNSITGYADLLAGGYHIVSDYHGRDSLVTAYGATLKIGMLVYEQNVDSTYRWNGTTMIAAIGNNGSAYLTASSTAINAFSGGSVSDSLFTLPTGINEFDISYVGGLYHFFYDDKSQTKHRSATTLKGLYTATDDATIPGRYPAAIYDGTLWHVYVWNGTNNTAHYTSTLVTGPYTVHDLLPATLNDISITKGNDGYYYAGYTAPSHSIGYLKSSSLNGPWTDLGYVLSSTLPFYSVSSADPDLFYYNNKRFVIFSGYDGTVQRICMVEVDSLMKQKGNAYTILSPTLPWQHVAPQAKIFNGVFLSNITDAGAKDRLFYSVNGDGGKAGWGYIQISDVLARNQFSVTHFPTDSAIYDKNTGIFNIPIASGGSGTVTSVTSANSDIGISVSSPNPVLTLNSGTGANKIVKRDGSGNIGVGIADLTATGTPSSTTFYRGDNTWATISGGGTTTNPLTLGYGHVNTGNFDGSSTVNAKIDSSLIQTVANFKPLGSTYWLSKTAITLPSSFVNSSLTNAAGGTFGTNAFNSIAYLPLTAGVGNPLTGTLNISLNSSIVDALKFVDTNTGGATWTLGPGAGTGSAGGFGFYTGTNLAMYILQNGFVGINYTADPGSGNKFGVNGNSYFGGNVNITGAATIGSLSGLLKGTSGVISTATAGTDYEVPLTFSTGLTRSTNTVTVNTSQNIATLSNLTSNGIVSTSGGGGTLGVTATTGSGNVVLATSPTLVTPALGTPTVLIGTNITGTASVLNIGGNAGSATNLQTARLIQGISFNGTADINPINGTGFVKSSGTTLSYDNSTYLTTGAAASMYLPIINPSSTGLLTNTSTSTATTRGIITAQTTSDNLGAKIIGQKSRGGSSVSAGDNLLSLTASPHDGTSLIESSKILFTAIPGSTVSTGIVPTMQQFQNMNTSGSLVTGLQITSDTIKSLIPQKIIGGTSTYLYLQNSNGSFGRMQRDVTSNTLFWKNQVLQPGGVGNALSFNGSTQYMTGSDANLPTGSSITLTTFFWIGGQAADATAKGVWEYGSGSGRLSIATQLGGTSMTVYISGNGGTLGSKIVTYPNDGLYHQICVAINGSSYIVYIDKTASSSGTLGAYNVVLGGSTSFVTNDVNGTNYYPKYKLDQLLIYNRYMSTTSGSGGTDEIAYNYNSGGGTATPITSGLIRDFELNSVTGSTAFDTNPNVTQANLTTFNSPTWVAGIVPTASSVTESIVGESMDGLINGELGIDMWGDANSRTGWQGKWFQVNQGASVPLVSNNTSQWLADPNRTTAGVPTILSGFEFGTNIGVGSGVIGVTAAPTNGILAQGSIKSQTNFIVQGSTSGTMTIQAPAVAGSAVITGPGVTGTLSTLAGTETYTNKTFASSTDVLGGVATTGFTGHATGDIYYDNAGVLTRLPIGTTGQIPVVSSGILAYTYGVPALFTSSSTSTVTNSTTETSIIPTGVGTYNLPVATTGKTFRALFGGVYSTPAVTAGSFSVTVYYGSTLIASGTASGLLAGASALSFNGQLTISTVTVGASGTIQIDGGLDYSVGNNLARFRLDLNNSGNAVTVANNATANFDVRITWDSASTSKILKTIRFSLEQLN